MRLFTDPHIGRRAGAHTTHESSLALDNAICENALTAANSTTTTVCAGDLFDKSHNKELNILQGLKVAAKCDLILAGNHDLANRDNTKTSIEIVASTLENVVRAEVSEVLVNHFEDDSGVTFTIIPHHSSQDLFDKALAQASSEVVNRDMVILHCNYNSPFANNDSSLNLSPEQATKLLEVYDYVVLGHEHNARRELNGRLVILGNTHPTNFGDITDKFYYDFDWIDEAKTKRDFIPTKCWDKSISYVKVYADKLLDGTAVIPESVKFIEVYGEDVKPELSGEIANCLRDLWVRYPGAYMIRNNVSYINIAVETVDKGAQLESVTDAITEKLAGTDLHDLWVKNLKMVNQND